MPTNDEQPSNIVSSWLKYDRIRVGASELRDPSLEKRRAQSAERQKAKRAAEWLALKATPVLEWKAKAPPPPGPTYADLLLKTKARGAARRKRERTAQGSHGQADLDEIRKCQDDRCRYCFTPLNGKGWRDHIISLVHGGSNDPSNLQWTCKRCSELKGAKPEQQFLAEMWAV